MAAVLIASVSLLVFSDVIHHAFVNWDDTAVLVDNNAYKGLDAAHLRWMFTTFFSGHYQPLTWLSFAVDHALWDGVDAVGYHLTNLLLHVATTLGFFLVCVQLLFFAQPTRRGMGHVVGATIAALLFSIHPLRVESVAWATERRDVLSGFWLMLTLACYLRAVRLPRTTLRNGLLMGSLVCYVLSLLSKAAGITLPFVLLLLDVYPLRRFSRHANTGEPIPTRSILREKLYYAIPAGIMALVALGAQSQSGALRSWGEYPPGLRIGQAMSGVVFYLQKTLWPTGLIPLYEQRVDAVAWELSQVFSGCLILLLSVWLWRVRHRYPSLLTAWAVFLVMLSPMLGLAQSGPQVVADRYSYLPCLSWALLAGGAVSRGWEVTKHRYGLRAALSVCCVGIIGILAALSRGQTRIWADSVTLWSAVIQCAPRTGTAYANLASEWNRLGDYERARRTSERALDILPGNRTAHIVLAQSSASLGDFVTAEKHEEIALQIRPGDTATMLRLAAVKEKLGKFAEAEQICRRLIDREPNVPVWHDMLGRHLAGRGRSDDAQAQFEKALALDPRYKQARLHLSRLLRSRNQPIIDHR